MALEQHYATGRRKEAVARVWLRPGTGKILINRRTMENYFGRETLKMIMRQPLELTQQTPNFDVVVNVKGGGLSGQAAAIRLGVTRALTGAPPPPGRPSRTGRPTTGCRPSVR